MHPGPTIKKLRKARGWNLEELATRIEQHLGKPVNTGNLSRLERELQGYSNDFLAAAAQAFDVDAGELFAKADVVMQEPGGTYVAVQAKEPIPRNEVIEVPRYENLGSAGAGIERHEADLLVGSMQVNARWVSQNLAHITNPKNLAIMVAFGESMASTIYDGDLVLVDRGVREVKIDAIYVFTMANELFIKTLQRMPGGAIRVISDNKKYEPWVIDASSKHEMEILARVVWAWNGRKL